MEDLKKKIVSLIGMMSGGRNLDFLCLAFQEIPRGDIAVAVLELCLDGSLVADRNGIAAAPVVETADAAATESVVATEPEVADAPATGPVTEVEVEPVAVPEIEPEAEDVAATEPAIATEPEAVPETEAMPEPTPEAQAFKPEVTPDIEYPASILRANDPVDMLELSTRPSNCLARVEIKMIGDLVRSLSSLATEAGVGEGSLKEIENAIAQRAASLTEPLEPRTAAELRGASGNNEYAFDAFGVLVAIRAGNTLNDAWAEYAMRDIEALGLGDAAVRRLKVNDMRTVADLLGSSPRAIAALPHVGGTLVSKIGLALTAYCRDASLDAGAWQKGLGHTADVEELLAFGGDELCAAVDTIAEACNERLYPVHEEYLRIFAAEFAWQQIGEGHSAEEAAELYLAQIEKAGALRSICPVILEDRCRRALSNGCDTIVPVPHAEPWNSIAAQMATIDGIPARFDLESHAIHIELAGITEWLDGLDDERTSHYLRMRLEGKTLQEIGDAEGITRERVRQITEGALENAYPLAEDRWRELFEAYDLNPEQFEAITGLGALSHSYLSITAKTKKAERKPLEQALADESVPDQVKEVIRARNLLPGHVFVGDKLIKASKQGIITHLLMQKASDFCMTSDELYDEYCAFLANHGLERSGRLDPTSPRAFTARVERLSDVMFAKVPADEEGNRRGIRYYDSNARDFTPLTQAIGELAASRDVEVSAEALMSEPALSPILEDLDIRNGYELHHVLSTWCPAICGVSLGRSPMLTLGEGDRRRQILALISEIGPADPNVLAEEYAKRYGVRPPTFKANFLNGFEQYNHDGLYSYEAAPLDDAQLATLRAVLAPVQGWCSASKVRTAFLSHYPDWSAELVTTENMAKVGFEISDGLLVRHDFDLRAAFVHMVCDPTSFELGKGEFQPEVCSNSIFVSELNKAERLFKIVEVRKGEYASCRVFETGEAPITREGFAEFVDRTIARMVPGRPYSIKSLRALGLTHELDAARDVHGLDDFFEESILSVGYVGGSLKRTSVAQTALFARTSGHFTICDVVDWYVLRRGSLGVTQLADFLEADHGVKAQLSNLRFAIQRSSMVFDAERDMAVLPDGTALLEEEPEVLPEEPAETEEKALESASDDSELMPKSAEKPTRAKLPEPVEETEYAEVSEHPEETKGNEQADAQQQRVESDLREETRPADKKSHADGPLFHGLLHADGLTLDGDDETATLYGRQLELTSSEFKVLSTLAMNPGKLFTREELCTALYGTAQYVDSRIVDSHVKNLRAKLGEDARNPTWVATVHGSGYRFAAEVDTSEAQGVERQTTAPVEYESADGTSRLCIDEAGRRVLLDGLELSLTLSEYKLLACLARHPLEVMPRLDLCEVVGIQALTNADARGVDSHLKNLRLALGDDARHPAWIGTAHGKGYYFIGKMISRENDAEDIALPVESEHKDDAPAPGFEPEPAPVSKSEPEPEPAPAPEPEPEPTAAPEPTPALEDADDVDAQEQEELLREIAQIEENLARVEDSLAEKERLREEYRELEKKMPELEDEMRSYGFFRRAEKQEAQARLFAAKARLESLRGKGSGAGALRKEAEELRGKLNGLRSKLGDR